MADPILDGFDPQSGMPRVVATAALTKPLPVIKASKMKAYICTQPVASMHRTDGKRIGFVSGYYETDLKYDQEFLDHEIAEGHPFLRYATAQEIEAAHMRMDPRGTMEKKVREDLEPKLRAELEAKIRAQLEKEISSNGGVKPALDENDFPATSTIDENKLAGTDIKSNAIDKLRKGIKTGNVIQQENATIIVDPASQNPNRFNPVSTVDLAGNAAESNTK